MEITRTFDLLNYLKEKYPEKEDVLCCKENGEWVKYSTDRYSKIAQYMACGLIEMGLKKGDKVITMSQNCPEWNFIDMACAQTGVIHVPIYPTLSTENYVHIITHSEAKYIMVGNKVLVNRLKPALEKVENPPQVYTLHKTDEYPSTFEILKLGIESHERNEPILDEMKNSITADDCATLIYTSGTTGAPKGVMLSHRNLCSNFLAHAKVNIMKPGDKVLSFLPLNHIYERSMNYHFQYLGVGVYYAENMGTIQQNMAEVRANGFCAVPRVLEMVYDKLYAAGKDFKGIKKKVYDRAFAHGARWDYSMVKKMSLLYQLGQIFYDRMVYRHWREKFGGNKLIVITGSSSIQPRMIRTFAAAGIYIYEGYGLSETSPVIAVNNPAKGWVKIGTVGPILEGVEVKFADDGEILTRGAHVMMGYYKDPEYTAQVMEPDGWFHTGDVGELVGNFGGLTGPRFLRITDRKKDIFKLSAGKYIAPQLMENKMRENEYIDQAMIIGENQKSVAAIISPNFNTLHYWALKHHLHYRDNAALLQMPETKEKFRQVIAEINRDFAAHEQIKNYRVVVDEWNANNGLLSPTLKLRRKPLMEKYKGLIAEIYGTEQPISNPIISAFRNVELPSFTKKK
ncbi:MAG: AMP-dependent synthetase/ligase [Bacteroidales bacterium]|nr:AMP-dependent synthetase/ligase [Bacteroidales bacterium]